MGGRQVAGGGEKMAGKRGRRDGRRTREVGQAEMAAAHPGCATVCSVWKQWPVFQSHMWMLPLSPPEAITPSSLTESELTMQLCPVMLCRNLPSGLSHFFMLSGEA